VWHAHLARDYQAPPRLKRPRREQVAQKCGTRILRVIHGRDARATFPYQQKKTVEDDLTYASETLAGTASIQTPAENKTPRDNHR